MPDEFDREALFRADDYLHFYTGGLSDQRSDDDAERVWRLLQLKAGERVLDVACGHGRIANRLAMRGAQVVGVDESESFLHLAREDARSRGLAPGYATGDMRELSYQDEFDAAVSWFTSFGYFDDDANREVLRGVRRALRAGGRFMLELNHRDFILRNLRPADIVERGDDLMVDMRTFEPLTSRMLTERIIVRGGSVRRTTFFVRMFTFPELRDWLLAAGFSSVAGYGEDLEPLSLGSRRMLVLARA